MFPADSLKLELSKARTEHLGNLLDIMAGRAPGPEKVSGDQPAAELVAEIREEMIPFALRGARKACEAWEQVWRHMAADGVNFPDFRTAGRAMLGSAISGIARAIRLAESFGLRQEAAQLTLALAELRDRLVEAEGGWPDLDPGDVLSPEEIAAARLEKAVDIDEVIRDLQGEE